MATYQVELPDGSRYEVEAPDGATEQQIRARVAEYAASAAPASEVGQGGPGMFRGLSAVAQQGRTFGLGAEIGGAGAATGEFLKNVVSDAASGNVPDVRRAWSAGGRAYDATVDEIRGEIEAFRAAHPWLATGAEIIGGLGGAKEAGQVFDKVLGAVKPGAAAAARRAALEGGTYGAVYGAGTGEGAADRAQRAALGGITGAVTGGAVGYIGGKMADKAARRQIPNIEEIKQQAASFYDDVDRAGVRLSGRAYDKLLAELDDAADAATFRPGLHPKTKVALDDLRQYAGQEHSLGQIDQARRVLAIAAKEPTDDSRVASRLIDALDDWVDFKLVPKDVIAGDAQFGTKALRAARATYHKTKKSELIADLFERAKDSAGSYTLSGYQNALQTQFRQLIKNPKRLRGFTEAERAAIRRVARDGSVDYALRLLGKMAPRGVISGGFNVGVGSVFGMPAGLATTALGEIGRAGHAARTTGQANLAYALTRAGGELPQATIGGGMRALGNAAGVAAGQKIPSAAFGGRPVRSQDIRSFGR